MACNMGEIKTEKFISDISAFVKSKNPGMDQQLPTKIVEIFCWYFYRVNIYIPTKLIAKQVETAKLILSKFNGKNHKALAVEHGLSVQSIYKIVKPREINHDKAKAAFFDFIGNVLPTEICRKSIIGIDDAKLLCNKLKQFIISRYAGCSFRISYSLIKAKKIQYQQKV